MSYTVWGAFDSFRKNYVDLDSDKVDQARRSRDYLYSQLKALADRAIGFPPISKEFIPFGSFARKTKIRPLDDIDFLMLLPGTGTTAVGGTTLYQQRLKVTSDTAPLARYADPPDNWYTPKYVNSVRVLNSIKSGLTTIPHYRNAEVRRNKQAVILNLSSYEWSFDIVPAVPAADWAGNTTHYLIPDGEGHWMRTDPRKDQANIREVNARHNSNFLPVVRLLKYWNKRPTQPSLSSYHFETICLNVFRYLPAIDNFGAAIKTFFDNAPGHVWQACADPKGLGPNLDADVTYETKQKVADAMKAAADNAWYARYYEERNEHATAMTYWQKIFGSNFPSYG